MAGNGARRDSERVYPVHNPADGSIIANVPDMGRQDTRKAIAAAGQALPAWSAKTAKERGAILRRWHDLILEHKEALARIVTAECGKPLAEALGEVAYGASFYRMVRRGRQAGLWRGYPAAWR